MFAYAHSLLARLMVDREGVTAMEYGVIAAGIVLVVATAAATLGTNVAALFNSIAGKL
ncbi:MAG TPA: Flp family type IVb pilin [Acetobacteraceae bacterium]|jgi:pilus assembly protein Flp/PilA|nr:Flp family type IVb pilin [Acetobacteraceae bacterium]